MNGKQPPYNQIPFSLQFIIYCGKTTKYRHIIEFKIFNFTYNPNKKSQYKYLKLQLKFKK